MAGRTRKKTTIPETPEESFNPEEFEDIDLSQLSEVEGQSPDEDGLSSVLTPHERLRSAKAALEQQLLLDTTEEAFSARSGSYRHGFENIVGVGISQKITNNSFTGVECVTVYVVAKASPDAIEPQAMVPETVNGVVTDVVATGEFFSFPNVGTYRPAPGGVSVGHYRIIAGTLGCLVRRGNKLYILSNNHVLANVNNAQIGDPILQPGPYDGGTLPGSTIAQLSEYVPIRFDGSVNQVDAAIAQASPTLVTPTNLKIGRISSTPTPAQRFLVVKKCGRTTDLTHGLITDVNATVRVGYGTNGTALFTDQILIVGVPYIAPFSNPGDSGSLIVSEFGNRPVGLLFAGSFTHTIANKIDVVLSQLNVSIVS